MSKCGWSYPPGCSGTPYDEDYPCAMCGEEAGQCPCPICGVCGAQGDPQCYDVEGHGLLEPQGYCARKDQEDAARNAARKVEHEWHMQHDAEYAQIEDMFDYLGVGK